MSTRTTEDLTEIRALYRLVMSSPEMLVQMSGLRNKSLFDIYFDIKDRLAEIEKDLRDKELKEAAEK